MVRLLALVAGLVALALGGCGGYAVKGRVVEGGMSTLNFVESDDGRLSQPGVPGVQLELYRDPDTLGRKLVGRGSTGPEGSFSIPLSAFGAGFLVEQFEITAQRPGYQPIRLQTALPGSGSKQRLLVVLAPGRSVPLQGDEDLMKMYEQYK